MPGKELRHNDSSKKTSTAQREVNLPGTAAGSPALFTVPKPRKPTLMERICAK